MAGARIKGITIEIGGDTTQLVKALRSADSAIKQTQTNLRDINKALKIDPANTNLLKDKQRELAAAISETKDKLQAEKEALEQMRNTEGFDANSQAARNLQTQIDLDTVALKDLEKQARQSSSVLGTQMQVAGDKIKEVGDKIKGVGDKIAGIGRGLTTTVTLPIVAAGTKMVSSFAEVDKTMTLTNATMNNTAEEADLLNKAMEEAASNSTFGMNEAAGATLNFARAGLTATEAANALAPAMNLAAGEAGDLDTVSGGLVATINGFGDSFEEAEHYADVFATACNNSALDVNSLSESMSVAAPIFKTAGKSVEDAALMLGVMANNGIEANVAANSLKTGMARLAQPTKQAREAMEQYGIAMSDIWNEDGSMKEMTVIQENLNRSFAKLSEKEQMAAAGAIFGKNQMASWLAVINTAPADVQELNAALSDTDKTTREMADAMMSGFGGSIEKLKSSIDVLMTSLGRIIAQYLTPMIEKIQELVDTFQALDDEQKDQIVRIAAIVAAVGPALLIVGKLTSAIGSIVSVVGGAVGGIGKLMTLIGGLASPVGIIVAALATLAAAFVYLYTTSEDFRNSINTVVGQLQEQFKKTIEQLQPIFETIKQGIEEVMKVLEPVILFISTAVLGLVSAILAAVAPVIDFIVNLVETIANVIKGLFALLNGDFDGFKAYMMAALQSFIDAIKSLIEGVVAFWISFFQTFGVNLETIIKGTWNAIKQNIQTALANITQAIQSKWTAIKTWLSTTLSNILSTVKTTFDNMKNAVSSRIDNIKSTIVDGIGRAVDYVKSLPSKFYDWGRDMIDNFIDGIRNKINAVRDAMGDIAGTIAEYIHFSTPDKGALKDADTYMPDFMNMITSGIKAGIPDIERAMNNLASAMRPEITAVGSNTGLGGGSLTVNVYGAAGQDVNELAYLVQQRINNEIYNNKAVFA